MASSTASGYGTYNPAGVDPFPIESVLAKIVGENNPAAASNMLDLYQIANTANASNYNAALGQQHQFAKDALQQQLYEANLKGLAEAKDPSVLQLMAGNPTYSGVLGTNTANIRDVLARAQANQAAVNYEKLGQGTSAFRAGGAAPDLSQIQQGYGINLAPVDPTQVEAARVRGEYGLAAAKVHAAASGEALPAMNYALNPPVGGVGPTTASFSSKAQRTFPTVDAQVAYLIKTGAVPAPPGYTGPTPTNPQGLGGGGTPAAGTPQQKGTVPGLKMAPSGGGPKVEGMQNSNADVQGRADALRTAIQNNQIAPDVAARIKSGMVNGQPRIGRLADGRLVALDGQGKPVQ